MPNRYAIATRIGSSKLYWNNLTRRWTSFNFATQFSPAERKITTLPQDAYWVSVLHGFGKGSTYPADSELKSVPKEPPAPAITNRGKKRGAK